MHFLIGWQADEGGNPNGLSIPPEDSGPYLPAGESGRVLREASHLTHKGVGYRYGQPRRDNPVTLGMAELTQCE